MLNPITRFDHPLLDIIFLIIVVGVVEWVFLNLVAFHAQHRRTKFEDIFNTFYLFHAVLTVFLVAFFHGSDFFIEHL